jgi:hypothetical protein
MSKKSVRIIPHRCFQIMACHSAVILLALPGVDTVPVTAQPRADKTTPMPL